MLPPGQHCIRIDRDKVFSRGELTRAFPGGVDPWEGTRYAVQPTRWRANLFDITSRSVILLVKAFTEEEALALGAQRIAGEVCLDMDMVAKWGIEHAWCPADLQELIHVGMDPNTRDIQLERRVIGYGSVGIASTTEFIWILGSTEDGRRYVRCEWRGVHPVNECYYIFVRSPEPI